MWGTLDKCVYQMHRCKCILKEYGWIWACEFTTLKLQFFFHLLIMLQCEINVTALSFSLRCMLETMNVFMWKCLNLSLAMEGKWIWISSSIPKIERMKSNPSENFWTHYSVLTERLIQHFSIKSWSTTFFGVTVFTVSLIFSLHET